MSSNLQHQVSRVWFLPRIFYHPALSTCHMLYLPAIPKLTAPLPLYLRQSRSRFVRSCLNMLTNYLTCVTQLDTSFRFHASFVHRATSARTICINWHFKSNIRFVMQLPNDGERSVWYVRLMLIDTRARFARIIGADLIAFRSRYILEIVLRFVCVRTF